MAAAAPTSETTTPKEATAVAAAEAVIGSDFEDTLSDITGTLSANDEEDMEVDAVVAKIPPEQRASVRALLEVRKTRLARRIQRHKKPSVEDAAAARGARRQ